LRREIQSGWPRRSSLCGTWRLLGRSRRAHVWRRFVPIISFDDALVLYALLTLFGRHGEAAWRGQDDTGRTRAAFRAGGRQLAFRHRSQLCERPALLAHIFVRRHRPPTSGQTHPAADQSVAIMETIPVDSWAVNVIGHFLARGAPADPLAVLQTIELIRHTFEVACRTAHRARMTPEPTSTETLDFALNIEGLDNKAKSKRQGTRRQ
jgi:hypothetical protein